MSASSVSAASASAVVIRDDECPKCRLFVISCKHYDHVCVECADQAPHHIYFNCIYCVFEGGDMECEFDGFEEAFEIGHQPYDHGVADGYNGVKVPEYPECQFSAVLDVYLAGVEKGQLQKKYDVLFDKWCSE